MQSYAIFREKRPLSRKKSNCKATMRKIFYRAFVITGRVGDNFGGVTVDAPTA